MTAMSMNLYKPDGRLRGECVYMLFCQDDGPIYIKIGITMAPLMRLSGLLTSCPVEPREYSWIEASGRDDARAIEHSLHRACTEWRVRGEWFRVTLEAKGEFRKLCNLVLDAYRQPCWPLKWTWIDVGAYLTEGQRRSIAHQAILRRQGGRAYLDACGAGLKRRGVAI